ncbi:MAG: glycosyltransferase family 87 protein, partial [Pyrinomonadaceae bacterium]
ILMAPLSYIDSQWQAVIWFGISLLALFGCFAESRRILNWLNKKLDSEELSPLNDRGPPYLRWLTGATVLLPVLNCLQRGQVDIVVFYFLILGFRCALVSRTFLGAVIAGVLLALPVVIKIIPLLPIGFLCLMFLFAAGFRSWQSDFVWRFVHLSLGFVAGALFFLIIIPSLLVGPETNARHLQTWYASVLTNRDGKYDKDFSLHVIRNQSLGNAVYRFGNWSAYVFGGAEDDRILDNPATSDTTMTMDDPSVETALTWAKICLFGLLLCVGWFVVRQGDKLAFAAVFSLSCMMMLVVSPVFRGHYYVFWWLAVWLVPLFNWRNGRTKLAIGLAAAACALTFAHYLFLETSGRLGVLGLGATVWYVVAAFSLFRNRPLASFPVLKMDLAAVET